MVNNKKGLLLWVLMRLSGYVAAVVSGILLSLSYPPSQSYWLAWIALAPVFSFLYFSKRYEGYVYGFITFAVYYSLTFQWIAAFQYLALPVMTIVSALLFGAVPFALFRNLMQRKTFWGIFVIPSLWVLFEYVKQNWLLSFPFGILGYTQYSWLRLIQIVDITGVFGVSWLILFVNALIARLLISLIEKPVKSSLLGQAMHISLVLLAFIIPLGYGTYRFKSLDFSMEKELKVGFAQTLFHPKRSWVKNSDEYFGVIMSQVDSLSGLDCDLIIFPELTVERFLTLDPGTRLKNNTDILNGLSTRAADNDVSILFGSLELAEGKKYNSSFLFSRNGDLTGIYRKQKLVPFGEQNPFGKFFPGIEDYMEETTDSIDLSKGDRISVMDIEGEHGPLRFGVLICFESGFSQLGRYYARENVDFIVNMTNDYWSLSSIAMSQHLVFSVFRAVETRKPVLRISNGGYSGYVNEFGMFFSKIPIFSKGMMTASLKPLNMQNRTVYTIFGDWFVVLCLIVVSSGFLVSIKTSNKD